jgi:hypothetical protein
MRVWLLDAVRYIPGEEPETFDGADPVTFPHCGKTQAVPAASIRFKRTSVTDFGFGIDRTRLTYGSDWERQYASIQSFSSDSR